MFLGPELFHFCHYSVVKAMAMILPPSLGQPGSLSVEQQVAPCSSFPSSFVHWRTLVSVHLRGRRPSPPGTLIISAFGFLSRPGFMRSLRLRYGNRHFSQIAILFYRCAVCFDGDTSRTGQRIRSIPLSPGVVNSRLPILPVSNALRAPDRPKQNAPGLSTGRAGKSSDNQASRIRTARPARWRSRSRRRWRWQRSARRRTRRPSCR